MGEADYWGQISTKFYSPTDSDVIIMLIVTSSITEYMNDISHVFFMHVYLTEVPSLDHTMSSFSIFGCSL